MDEIAQLVSAMNIPFFLSGGMLEQGRQQYYAYWQNEILGLSSSLRRIKQRKSCAESYPRAVLPEFRPSIP